MDAPSDEHRIEALRSTRLLDSSPERGFDRLTRLAAGLLHAPVALVSLVDERRQFFKSAFGLAEPWASRRETPLSHSFCQYATKKRARLVVNDAREHPVLRHNLAVRDLDVIAYAGVPLLVEDEAIGAFCVIDHKPREWSAEDLALLEEMAASAVSEIELRTALRTAREQRALLDVIVESLGDAVLAVDANRVFTVANAAARRIFADEIVAGRKAPPAWTALHRSLGVDGKALLPEDGPLARGLHGFDTDDLTFTSARPGSNEHVWVEATGRTMRDGSGEIVGAVAVFRDVTERKRQADLYAAVVRSIPRGAVSLFDADLRCLAIDGSALRAGGTGPDRLVGKTMRALAGAAGDDRFDRIEAMYRYALAGETLSTDFDDAVGRTLELHMAPVRDGIGRIVAGIVLALDVTAERRTEAALHRREQIDRAIIANLPNVAVLMIDRDMRFVSAEGPILPDVLRRAKVNDLVGMRVEDVATGDAEQKAATVAVYQSALEGGARRVELQRGDLFFELSTVPVQEEGVITHALVFVYDVTRGRREADALRQARDSLARERELFDVTLRHLVEGVVLIDPDRRVVLANPAYAAMMGVDPDRAVGLTFEQFIETIAPRLAEPRSLVEILGAAPPAGVAEFSVARPQRRILRRVWMPVVLEGRTHTLAMWRDVTAERDLLAERERQLLVDALTGVANRRGGELALAAEHERTKRYGTRMCVAVIDVDFFKRVNDQWGHPAGDEVLRQVAGALAAQARASDTVARWGGEEFLAVLPVGLDGARIFGERVRSTIESIRCDPVGRVTVSIGIAEVAKGEAANDALARADERLYEAKRAGRNRVVS